MHRVLRLPAFSLLLGRIPIQDAGCSALPPEISHMTVWSPITLERKLDDEEAIQRGADHWLPALSRCWTAHIKELCRKHGYSEPSYYACKAKFGGMKISDAQRLNALEAENDKIKGCWPTRCSKSTRCARS
jgi:hypothetical protein